MYVVKITDIAGLIHYQNTHFLPDRPGVYALYNETANRYYIGSSYNIKRRIHKHISDLNNNKCKNQQLQKDYKNSRLMFVVLDCCNEQDALIKEQEYIIKNPDSYNTKIINSLPNKDILIKLENKIKSRIIVDKNGCWIWNHWKWDGYGYIRYKNKSYPTHRIMFAANNIYNNINLPICHTCNNKACCNPKHLYAGTPRDNAIDHGKTVRKHSDSLIKEIRDKYCSTDISMHKLGKEYGFCVISILNNTVYYDPNYTKPIRSKISKNKQIFTKELLENYISQKMTMQDVADKHGVTRKTVEYYASVHNLYFKKHKMKKGR